MPLPLIPLIAAGAVGLFGAGKTVKAVMDNSKANDVNERANSIAEEAKKRINLCREASGASLEALGGKKAYVFANNISQFVDVFGKLKNVKLEGAKGIDELGHLRFDKQALAELKQMSDFASSILGGTATGAVAGALTAFGAYSGVMAFGAASTGTAIATLSGAAATNATLAFLGGGSLAAGGAGMAGGMMVLGGLVAAPALAVLGLFMGSKASANLDNAYSNLSEARKFSEEMETAATLCNGIRRRAYMFERLLIRLDSMLSQALMGMRQAIEHSGTDWRDFSSDEKKTVGIAASLVTAIKSLLDTPILTEDGKLTEKSLDVAQNVQKTLPSVA